MPDRIGPALTGTESKMAWIAPSSTAELEERIRWLGACIAEAIPSRYEAVLAVGSAARGESTFGPDGRLLSDVDLCIVLPQRRSVAAWWASRGCREAIRGVLPGMDRADWIHTGYAHRAPCFWRMATPFMFEWKTNARVLSGSDDARLLPDIERSEQIPRWEGLRLIGNRLCEVIGGLGKADAVSDADVSDISLTYRFLKLLLACSEARLIGTGRYAPSYRERLERHCESVGETDAAEAELYLLAYQAKLNENRSFFQRPVAFLGREILPIAFSTLSGLGVAEPDDWVPVARRETSGAPGWPTDFAYFALRILHGDAVSLRRAIAAVYRDAHRLALGLNQFFRQGESGDLPRAACRRIAARFAVAPQFVSVLRGKDGRR